MLPSCSVSVLASCEVQLPARYAVTHLLFIVLQSFLGLKQHCSKVLKARWLPVSMFRSATPGVAPPEFCFVTEMKNMEMLSHVAQLLFAHVHSLQESMHACIVYVCDHWLVVCECVGVCGSAGVRVCVMRWCESAWCVVV